MEGILTTPSGTLRGYISSGNIYSTDGVLIGYISGEDDDSSYKAIICWDGASTPVVANIPAGVTVTYQGVSYTGTLEASSATKKYIYLVKVGSGTDQYDEYKTYQDQNNNWFWELNGTARLDLTLYRTASAQDIIDATKQNKTLIATTIPADGLLPNVLYQIAEMVTSTLTLQPGTAGEVNEYMLSFGTGAAAPTITWPSGLTWAGGSAPSISASKHYEISIINNYAVCREF